MTRKDFEAIAAIIRQNTVEDAAAGFDEGYDAGVHIVATDLADYFATVNPRFDRRLFLEACAV